VCSVLISQDLVGCIADLKKKIQQASNFELHADCRKSLSTALPTHTLPQIHEKSEDTKWGIKSSLLKLITKRKRTRRQYINKTQKTKD